MHRAAFAAGERKTRNVGAVQTSYSVAFQDSFCRLLTSDLDRNDFSGDYLKQIRLSLTVLVLFATSASQPVAAAAAAETAVTVVEEQNSNAPDSVIITPLDRWSAIRDCPAGIAAADTVERVCRIPSREDVDELRDHLAKGEFLWREGRTLVFSFQGSADQVWTEGSIQLPMSRVANTNVWVLRVHVGHIDRAVVGYGFRKLTGAASVSTTEDRVWRGRKAPNAPARSAHLHGTIEHDTIASVALGQRRQVSVYMPPPRKNEELAGVLLMADGQWMDWFTPILDTLVLRGCAPRIALVGIHAAEVANGSPLAANTRAQEYLLGFEPGDTRFLRHERFVLDEVLPFVKEQYQLPLDRERTAVFGVSNGAAFAVALAMRNESRFSRAVALSPAGTDFFRSIPRADYDRTGFFILGGDFEPDILSHASDLGAFLAAREVEHVLHVFPGGHDPSMWQLHFPAALDWIFDLKC